MYNSSFGAVSWLSSPSLAQFPLPYSIMAALLPFLFAAPLAAARQVSISVNGSNTLGHLATIARFFGCDEPNYAYQPDGKALLQELGQLGPAQTYFRTHNLLTTDDGPRTRLKWGSTNAYTEDANGNPIYNWTIIDEIFDTYLERNVKPYAQIGFMPKALAIDPEPYTFNFDADSAYNVIYVGWSHPPTSYEKWGELVYQWAKHSVERYGADEVNTWYWEVWNEANIPYWNGTEEQYFELYDYAVNGVRRALPSARVGGPEVAGGGTGASGTWLQAFLQHTIDGQNNATNGTGSPIDFLSFHAKGSPLYVNATDDVPAHQQMNVSASLTNVRDAFDIIASYPTLKNLPIVIGEDDPDGCAACESAAYSYRNGLMYPAYTVEAFVRDMQLAEAAGVNLDGTLTWAFEYDDHEFFDGFRVLSTNQVDKPILNAFRMFGKMTGSRVQASSDGEYALDRVVAGSVRNESDVGVLASLDNANGQLAVLVWNYHDDELPKPDVDISLDVALPWTNCESVKLTHYRVDNDRSNAYQTWLAMGSPQDPTWQQYSELRTAGQLQLLEPISTVSVEGGKASVNFALPIHGLSLLVMQEQSGY